MKILAGVVAVLALLAGGACEPRSDGLVVRDAIYRAPLGTSEVGVAYVTLKSVAGDRIVAVSSDMAGAVEMHATVTADGRSRMQRVETVELPAGREVAFSSGGLHLMVMAPKPVAGDAGDASATFPIQFQLESGRTQIVRFLAGTGPAHHE